MKNIIYKTEDGGVAIVYSTGVIPIEEVAKKDVPVGAEYEIVDSTSIPSDRTFRDAWVKEGKNINHDLDKAKSIAHDMRRAARTEEFAPHDEVIMKQIPGADATKAEEARQAIRDKYAAMQTEIDAASDVDALKSALGI